MSVWHSRGATEKNYSTTKIVTSRKQHYVLVQFINSIGVAHWRSARALDLRSLGRGIHSHRGKAA